VSPRTALAVLVAAAVLALGGSRSSLLRPGADAPPASALTGRVVRVVDGDTVHVRVGRRDETVRYIGIDTPESVKPGTPVQCFAHAASAANARLVAGRAVRLVPGRETRDRYGRLLAYVYRASDGAFVNARLVAWGYARTLTIAPNDRFAARFAVLARAARRAGRGLWSRCRGVR
jgi:micrococcal nuclease